MKIHGDSLLIGSFSSIRWASKIFLSYSLRKSCPCEFLFCPVLSIGLLAQELCLTLVTVNYWGSAGLREKCKQARESESKNWSQGSSPCQQLPLLPFPSAWLPKEPLVTVYGELFVSQLTKEEGALSDIFAQRPQISQHETAKYATLGGYLAESLWRACQCLKWKLLESKGGWLPATMKW